MTRLTSENVAILRSQGETDERIAEHLGLQASDLPKVKAPAKTTKQD